MNLGFVSAYVLARGGEAAVVDTGTAGSEGDIAAALERIGLGWDAVGHVIVTHRHSDHVGGLGPVLQALPPEAIGYAGAEDIPVIPSPESLVAVADGDDVFGLTIIATPGHTPGHISVLDEVGGILIAGDALGTTAGQVAGPNPQFTPDMATALESVAKLGTFQFETLLVGHGDPIVSGRIGSRRGVQTRLRIRQPATCASRADERRRADFDASRRRTPRCYSGLGQIEL